jgi:hypothetical protein
MHSNCLHLLQTDGAQQLSLEPSTPWRVKVCSKTWHTHCTKHDTNKYIASQQLTKSWCHSLDGSAGGLYTAGYVLYDWDIRFRVLADVANASFHYKSKILALLTPYPVSGYGNSFPGSKMVGAWSWPLISHNTAVTNARSSISTASRSSCRGVVKYRNNTFPLSYPTPVWQHPKYGVPAEGTTFTRINYQRRLITWRLSVQH